MKNWGVHIAIVLGVIAVIGAKAFMQADRDSTGAIASSGSISAFQIRVGDCFNDTSASYTEGAGVSNVPGVPCAEPHDNEVFAVLDVGIESFPENDGMSTLALDLCLERFEGFVGKDYESSSLDIVTMYPSRESWAQNDREVVCAVYDMNANKLVGSVRGLAL